MKSQNLALTLLQPRAQIFCKLCETKSFTEAAKQLGISQSVVSRTIADLENELFVSLVDHSVRPIQLTPAGKALYQLLNNEFNTLNEALSEVRERHALRHPLRLGVVESVAANLSSYIVKRMAQDCSNVTVLTGISPYLLRLLDEDHLDMIICPDPFLNRNDLSRKFIFLEPSVIVAPKNIDLPQPITWQRLQYCGLPLVSYHESNAGGKLGQNFFNKMGLNFVNRIRVDINALLLSFVSEGMGWGLTRPTTLVQHPDLSAKVNIFPMPDPVVSREVYLINRKGQHEQFSARVAKIAAQGYVERIVPACLKLTPWIKPYLFIAGEKSEESVPLFGDNEAISSDVWVL